MTYRTFNTIFTHLTGYRVYSLNCYAIEKLINHPERLPISLGQHHRSWDSEITEEDLEFLKNSITPTVYMAVMANYKLKGK